MVKKIKSKKKKVQKLVSNGRIYIKSSFNNTLITITDLNGNVLSWASAGTVGFKGTRKSTPYAAQMATNRALEKVKSFGLSKVEVLVSGVGTGRDQALRSLGTSGLQVSAIKDITPIPHNGPRAKKPRRV